MSATDEAQTRELVRIFYSSLESKDFAALRDVMHDDMHFQGPLGAGDADTFVAKLAKLSSLTESLCMKHLFVEAIGLAASTTW